MTDLNYTKSGSDIFQFFWGDIRIIPDIPIPAEGPGILNLINSFVYQLFINFNY
jgi:hypothetical protein